MLSKEEIEQARSILLRGNNIESASLILRAMILEGWVESGGRVNILKVATRQILSFIEEYKNKGYLDVVKEKVQANEKSRQLENKANKYDLLVEKIEKELKETDVYLEESENKTYRSITQELENYQKAIGKKEVLMEILKLTREDSMSKANEMFKKLGYTSADLKDKFDRVWGISYKNTKTWVEIIVDYKDAEICVGTLDDDSEPVYIGIEELQAINEKVKELGWNE